MQECNSVNKVVLILVGVVRKVVTSVHGYEEDIVLMASDNSACSLKYTHFNNILYL